MLIYPNHDEIFNCVGLKDMDSTVDDENLQAYAKIKVKHLIDTNHGWTIRQGKSFELSQDVTISINPTDITRGNQLKSHKNNEEVIGIPRKLLPLYAAFLFDSIAVGMVMPLLPFFLMELGANALELTFVVSSNYLVQMVGCLVMGSLSDRIGRRFVLLSCLMASSLSYFFVSRSKTLSAVTCARIIVGLCGGLVPVMQTCVAGTYIKMLLTCTRYLYHQPHRRPCKIVNNFYVLVSQHNVEFIYRCFQAKGTTKISW